MIHITLEPEFRIEPGHQWLVVEDSPEGRALITMLTDHLPLYKHGKLMIAHDHQVDRNIVDLINQLAHVRFQSPSLVQMTLLTQPILNLLAVEDDGGLEGA